MNEQILSFSRTLLKLGGGFLLAKGWTDQPGIEALIGGVLATIGVIWSAFHHAPAPPK